MRPDQLTELRSISIEARSPTGAVIARTAGRGLPRVEINGGHLREHTEHSLAAEIEEAIAEALEARREEVEAIVNGPLREEFAARRENLSRRLREQERLGLNAIREIDASGVSPKELVTARIFADGDIVIEFTNRPLRDKNVATEVLTSEVNGAIEAASMVFSMVVAKTFTDMNTESRHDGNRSR